MVSSKEPLAEAGDALVIVRVFDARVDLVWQAWTDVEHFKKWCGPKDFTCPVAEFDFRVGGRYLSCIRGTDGKDVWSTGVYREIVPMQRIVMTDSFADADGNAVPATYYGMEGVPPEMLISVTFEDLGGRTRMTLRHEGVPGEHLAGANEGWNGSFDKLAETLAAWREL